MFIDTSPLEYIFQHLSVIGWPTLCYGIWRASRFITTIESRALQAEQHITKMATNCFPTMQASLKNQDGLMHSMDESLKTLVTRTPKTKKR